MKPEKRTLLSISALSSLFTIMQIVGYQLSMLYNTSVHTSDFFQNIGVLSLPQCLFLALLEFPFWCVVLYILFRLLDKLSLTAASKLPAAFSKPLLWAGVAVLLFVCWIPALLACYPGCYNYDAIGQIPQAMYEDVPYNSHHPLLHTLIMGKIITWTLELTGCELNFGIFIYCIFQMIVCAMILSYSLYCITKISRHKILLGVSFLYYAFFPTIVLFTMSTTKDVLFSLFFHLVTILVYDMYQDIELFFASPPKIGRFALISTIACLLRNNGIYAILIFAVGAILLQKKCRLQTMLFTLCLFCLFIFCSKGLEYGLHAQKGGKIEMLSVPIQQVARVYRDHGPEAFEEEELEFLYTIVSHDTLMSYNPFLSDPVKNYILNDVLFANIRELFKLWLNTGLEHPLTYFRAFLDNTYQAWYPGTSILTSPSAEKTYYFDITMSGNMDRETKNLDLIHFYDQISTGFLYQKFPVLRLFFSIGTMLWTALFAFGYGFCRKRSDIMMPMTLVLAYSFTNFLGPVSLVRYYLILFYGFPIFISFVLSKKSEKQKGIALNDDSNEKPMLSKIA